mgnify:CR=1 FL=1
MQLLGCGGKTALWIERQEQEEEEEAKKTLGEAIRRDLGPAHFESPKDKE